jgi:3-oxoacyl-[acyl-carrier-protein] synthase II
MRDREAVLITGIGVLSPIGLCAAEVAQSLLDLRSGIREFRAPPLSRRFPAGVVAMACDPAFLPIELPYLDRCQQLAILAARQAAQQAGLQDFASLGARAGLYYGNVNGGSASSQECHRQLLCADAQASKPFAAMAIMQNAAAAQISIRHRIKGPVHTYGSACAASGAAIGEAARAIGDGYLDIALAGGAEAPLNAGLFFVFDGARALAACDAADASRSCRPFCLSRDGLVLAEGAAFLVLESKRHAGRRGAQPLAEIAGYGIASDAFHIAAPGVEGAARALRQALHDADFLPGSIDYINAHATGTASGDVAEAKAICSVFGDAAIPVSSTKALHGHLLGAAGALECVITVLALRAGMLPATAFLAQPDPCCRLRHVLGPTVTNCRLRRALSLSCGFGGTSVALAIALDRDASG